MNKIAAAIILAMSPSLLFANSESAFQLYFSGDYQSAKPKLIDLAQEKNPRALYYLATMQLNGYGILRNSDQGLITMQAAAKAGNLDAQMYLGRYYMIHQKDLSAALPWLNKAANQGNLKAQVVSALAYLNGLGVKKNTDKAKRYVIQAAKNGNTMAQYELAIMFLKAKHSTTKKMGRIWLNKSAKSGYAPAEYKLATMLLSGKQMKKDPTRAAQLLQQAAAKGNEPAKKALQNSDETQTTTSASNNAKQVTTKLSATQQLNTMLAKLKSAGITFKANPAQQVTNNSYTMTPRLVNPTTVVQIKPDYQLVTPSEIPIADIIYQQSRVMYKQNDKDIIIPRYQLRLPHKSPYEASAMATLKRQASHGHPKAMFELGQAYQLGKGVTKNNKIALKYYLKSSVQGYIKADYMVGLFYLSGSVVEKNYKTAMQWLNGAAMRGSPQAQTVLANIYEFGLGTEGDDDYIAKNMPQAIALYNLAASHNLPDAQLRLAQIYSSGAFNPSRNADRERYYQKIAFQLYQKAAKQGNQTAEIALAYYYAKQGKQSKHAKWAFDIASKAAAKGDVNALFIQAILYDRGIGVEQNKDKAIDIYEQLAEKGNTIALFMLGTYNYLHDRGSKSDAIDKIVQAANQGSPYGYYNLAIFMKKDLYQAPGETFTSILQRAIDKHYYRASRLLADYYLAQQNDTLDVKRAAEIYTRLAEKGDIDAQLKLGYMYNQGIFFQENNQLAAEWFQKAAQNHNPVAQYILGFLYQAGIGVDRNIKQSLRYYHQSAKQNYTPSEVALGYIYEMDKYDYKKAKYWYLKAAKNNSPQGQYNLGLLLQYKKVKPKTENEAFSLMQKSATQGYVYAENMLANMYSFGNGVSSNSEDALTWYTKAANKDNTHAKYSLGLLYETGVDGEIDLEKARSFYQAAAEHGNLEAKIAMARFYEYGLGIDKNMAEAGKYYAAAARQGNAYAKWKQQALQNHATASSNKYTCGYQYSNDKKSSVWKKIGGLFENQPTQPYRLAINQLNQGQFAKVTSDLMIIVKEFPKFKPAKQTLSDICKQSTAIVAVK